MAIRSADYIGGYGSSLPHLDVRVDPLEHLRACDYGDAEVLVGNTLGTFDLVREFVGGGVDAGVTPIILGGDHAVTWCSTADHSVTWRGVCTSVTWPTGLGGSAAVRVRGPVSTGPGSSAGPTRRLR